MSDVRFMVTIDVNEYSHRETVGLHVNVQVWRGGEFQEHITLLHSVAVPELDNQSAQTVEQFAAIAARAAARHLEDRLMEKLRNGQDLITRGRLNNTSAASRFIP